MRYLPLWVLGSLILTPPTPSLADDAAPTPGQPLLYSGLVRQKGTRRGLPAQIITPGGVPLYADSEGKFEVNLPPGSRLLVTSPGYLPQQVLTPPLPERDWVITLELAEGDVVVVTADGAEKEHASATTLPRQMVDQTPGTYGDSLRLVQSLPGVSVTPEFSPRAGDVAVRGTGPGDNRFFLDGVDIPYLYHFQQYSSVVPTDLLEDITLYPSTFRPVWGDAIGAVVEARTRDFRPDTVHARANVNLVMAGGAVEVPVGDHGAIVASARRSYLDRASSNSAEYTVWPIFWDYHARYDYRLATGRRIGLFAFGAGDSYQRYLLDRTEPDPVAPPDRDLVTFEQSFHAVGSRCDLLEGPYRSRSVVALVLGQQEVVSTTGDREGIDDDYAYVRHDGEAELGDKFTLNAGGEIRAGKLSWQGDPRGGAYSWPEPVLPTPEGTAQITSRPRTQVGIYTELTWHLPGDAQLKPGIRLDTDSLSHSLEVDPRVTAVIPIGELSAVRAAAGLYHQAPDPLWSDPGQVDPEDLDPSLSREVALGLETTFAGRLRAHVQGYYKDLENLSEVDTPGHNGELTTGIEGTAWGMETVLRYHLQDLFFMWVSYSWSHSERVDPATEESYRSDYDQPHSLNVVGAWQPTPRWNVGIRYRLASGLSYTPVEGAIYDGGNNTWVPLPGERNSEQFPLYQKIDGHVEHSRTFDRWTLAVYAESWFVVPSGNVLYPVYSYDYSEMQAVRGPVFVPLVGIRGSL